MGPHERAGVERRIRELKQNLNRSRWEDRELDRLEEEIANEEFDDRMLGRNVPSQGGNEEKA